MDPVGGSILIDFSIQRISPHHSKHDGHWRKEQEIEQAKNKMTDCPSDGEGNCHPENINQLDRLDRNQTEHPDGDPDTEKNQADFPIPVGPCVGLLATEAVNPTGRGKNQKTNHGKADHRDPAKLFEFFFVRVPVNVDSSHE